VCGNVRFIQYVVYTRRKNTVYILTHQVIGSPLITPSLHGLRIGKDIFTYEDNVPSCPLPFLIFCIAPGTCERQAWPLPSLSPRWLGPRWLGPRWLGPRWLGPRWGKTCNSQHQSPKGYILITSTSYKHIMQIRHINYLCYPTNSDSSATTCNSRCKDETVICIPICKKISLSHVELQVHIRSWNNVILHTWKDGVNKLQLQCFYWWNLGDHI
jgi:hypothetical protein